MRRVRNVRSSSQTVLSRAVDAEMSGPIFPEVTIFELTMIPVVHHNTIVSIRFRADESKKRLVRLPPSPGVSSLMEEHQLVVGDICKTFGFQIFCTIIKIDIDFALPVDI